MKPEDDPRPKLTASAVMKLFRARHPGRVERIEAERRYTQALLRRINYNQNHDQ